MTAGGGSQSRTRTGRDVRSVADTVHFPTQTAYCNDQIIHIIAWEKKQKKTRNSYPKLSRSLARVLGFPQKEAAVRLFIQFDTAYLVTCVRVPKSRDLIDCSTSIQPMY